MAGSITPYAPAQGRQARGSVWPGDPAPPLDPLPTDEQTVAIMAPTILVPHPFGSTTTVIPPRPWDQRPAVPGTWPQPRPAPPFAPPANHQPYPRQCGNAIAPSVFTPYGAVPCPRPSHWKLYLGAALAALVATVVLITGFGAPGFLLTRKLDIVNTQAGIQQFLSDPAGYGAKNVGEVTCNDGANPTIAKGATFICQVSIDRIKQSFVVTFTDDKGNYQISPPQQGIAV